MPIKFEEILRARVDPEQKRKIEEIGLINRWSTSHVVREAIKHYLRSKRNRKPPNNQDRPEPDPSPAPPPPPTGTTEPELANV